MEQKISQTISFIDKIVVKYYDSIYTMSIAKEVTTTGGSNGGILIIGMLVAIVAIIGFILTTNRK